MRIGIYNPYLDGLTGGEKYMLTIAACLAQNHEVYVFWDDVNILKNAQKKFNIELDNVSLTKNIFSSKISTVNRINQSRNYDAIIVLSDGSIPFLLSKKTFLHFQFPVEWVNATAKTKIKLLKITNIFCNSNYTKKYIDKKFGCNSIVLYPPVDIKSKKLKKEDIILTVGRFGRTVEGANYKKHDILIREFKDLVDNGLTGWKLILAISLRDEDKERFNQLEDLAKNYPIEFKINISNDELWKLYSKAKIYWHASGFGEDLEKHPEYAEHFGISTVEAMGAGAVPVVIKAGGQTEIVKDNENGFVWSSLEELRKKTIQLTDDKDLMNALSVNAQKDAEKFNISRFCKEINEIIYNEK